MNFFKLLDKLKRKSTSLILYSLLDRIPIIVFGENSNKIDDFLVILSELVHFRKEFVFYTDFISGNDYNNLIQIEDIDYNSQRAHIRCPCNVALKALDQFDFFNSWIIGISLEKQKDKYHTIRNEIRKKTNKFLSVLISSNTISVNLEGANTKLIDLSFEQKILHKITQDTEKSVARMKRVLSEKIKSNKLDQDLINTLLDFDTEKNELKKNIFKKEIQNFYSGSKRALFILTRLDLLNSLDINTKIGSNTLLETIDYEDAPIERILSFITNEWGEDFTNLIENEKRIFIGDKIQSLWG